jgi:hypothetical protein
MREKNMQNVLQIVANIGQIFSALWMLICGGKAFWEIKIGVKPSTIKMLHYGLLAFLLVWGVSIPLFLTHVIPLPWYSLPKKVVAVTPIIPCCPVTPTPAPIGNIAKGKALYQKIILGGPPSQANNLDAQVTIHGV